jgi:putative radical SAM enzyme (TIGR03279 family)
MSATVLSIIPGSPASSSPVAPGDTLRKINGSVICDCLDYQYHSYDSRLLLEFTCPDGKIKLIKLRKPEGLDIGLEFESYLMDKEKSCSNKCVFCFIDQLPKGMRCTLYYKDDDVRLSLLHGNYISLTNLSDNDIERLIKLRISPINVSIHTLDPALRNSMLGTNAGSVGIDAFKTLVKAGIIVNCQIVCCPGINDGIELKKTIEGLIGLGTCINSVSIVPVGLTKHRAGLAKLRPFDKTLAAQTVKQVEHYGEICLKERGTRVFFCADELYMMAEFKLPPNDFYEDYPQLENGVGMMRLFTTEFEEAMAGEGYSSQADASLATGVLVYPYLTKLSNILTEKCDTIKCNVHAVRNDFFGESITVSGLITGQDLIKQLKGKKLGSKLFIPQNMLRHGESIFLDDVTVADVSNALGVPVRVIKQNGADLFRALTAE